MEWKGGVGNGCVCIDSERDAILIFLIHCFPSSKRIGMKTKMHKIFQMQSFVPKISEFAIQGLEWEAWEGAGIATVGREMERWRPLLPPVLQQCTTPSMQSDDDQSDDRDDHNDDHCRHMCYNILQEY